MKWATVVFAFLYSVAASAQLPYSTTGDSVSIHGTISGLSAGMMCSAELKNALSGFTVQRTPCGSSGFDFSDVPRGTYVVIIELGTNEIERKIDADMPNTEVDVRVPENTRPATGGSSTVSVAEMMIPEKARNLFNKASSLLQQEKPDKAQQKLREALAIAPRYAKALALQAVICTQKDNISAAMKSADSAVASDAQLPFAQFVRAMVLNASGSFKQAASAAEEGLRMDMSSWQGHFELAHAFYGLGNLSSAITEINRAESSAPKGFPDVHLLKAMILIHANQLEQAKQELAGLGKDGGHDSRVQELNTQLAKLMSQK